MFEASDTNILDKLFMGPGLSFLNLECNSLEDLVETVLAITIFRSPFGDKVP